MDKAAPMKVVFDAYIDFLLLGGRLRAGAVPEGDPFRFKEKLKTELAAARKRCQGVVPAETLDRIEYAVVGFLDESALSGGEAVVDCWRAGTLEGELYDTGIAGEVFFQRLDEALKKPRPPEPFLLVCLLCLLEGFQGELAQDSDGDRRIAQWMSDLRVGLRRALPRVEPVGRVPARAEMEPEHTSLPIWVAPILAACVLLVAGVVMWSIAGNAVEAFAVELVAGETGSR